MLCYRLLNVRRFPVAVVGGYSGHTGGGFHVAADVDEVVLLEEEKEGQRAREKEEEGQNVQPIRRIPRHLLQQSRPPRPYGTCSQG